MAFYNPYYGYQQPNYNYQNQIQDGGFVTVQSEDEARLYPLRHGTSVTFRDENAPFIYTKTLGFGQLDLPTFEKYRLVKENAQKEPENTKGDDLPIYATKADLEALRDDVERLRKELGDE